MVVVEVGLCGDGGFNSGEGIFGGFDCLFDVVFFRFRRF